MSRRILAIESATDWLSVALLEDERVLAEEAAPARMQHASAILPAIDSLFRKTALGLTDLDAIAVSTGPGSFTSLRIGIATIKGLAFRRDLPTLGISTLEAMAFARLGPETGHEPVLALLDARRGEWYAGSFRSGDSADALPEPVLPEGLYSPEAIAERLLSPVRVVAPETGNWEGIFRAAGVEIAELLRDEHARPSAAEVGRLASRRFARGAGGPAATLGARYLRRAEAEARRLGGPVEEGERARLSRRGRAS